MSKRVRQYIGILAALVAYYLVHEGAHLLYALLTGVFKKINFMGLGVQIDVYSERMTDTQMSIFCLVGAVATFCTGYLLTVLAKKICQRQSKLLRAMHYYITIAFLLLDPLYLSVLCGFFGGGDMNGIALLCPEWAAAEKAFQENTNILIALPLYVENIPGILLEFLYRLEPKKTPCTKLSFLLQGGFPEANQSRCCEAFLETLPAQLGCEYAGTLIKGDMFGVGLVDEKNREKMLAPFRSMGRVFARSGCFEKSAVDAFAAPEYMPKKQIRMYNLFGKHISRFFMWHIAKKLGCREKLDARPLAE